MAEVDFSGVSASWNRNPPRFAVGDLMEVTVAGQAMLTGDPVLVAVDPFEVEVTADGQPCFGCHPDADV